MYKWHEEKELFGIFKAVVEHVFFWHYAKRIIFQAVWYIDKVFFVANIYDNTLKEDCGTGKKI